VLLGSWEAQTGPRAKSPNSALISEHGNIAWGHRFKGLCRKEQIDVGGLAAVNLRKKHPLRNELLGLNPKDCFAQHRREPTRLPKKTGMNRSVIPSASEAGGGEAAAGIFRKQGRLVLLAYALLGALDTDQANGTPRLCEGIPENQAAAWKPRAKNHLGVKDRNQGNPGGSLQKFAVEGASSTPGHGGFIQWQGPSVRHFFGKKKKIPIGDAARSSVSKPQTP